MCLCLNDLVKWLNALLTPVIACVAAYIAWQQWKTNQLKLVLDRYDRRLKVYDEVRQLFSAIVKNETASLDELVKFKVNVYEAEFLFGVEIHNYVDEIYKHTVMLNYYSQACRDETQVKPHGYNHQDVCNGKKAELDWLIPQFKLMHDRFKKYLDVSRL